MNQPNPHTYYGGAEVRHTDYAPMKGDASRSN